MPTTFKPIPAHIIKPEYVGKKAPTPYKGSDVQTVEVIEKIRIAGSIAADAMHKKIGVVTGVAVKSQYRAISWVKHHH